MVNIPDSTTHFPVIGISGSSADSDSVRAAITQIRDAGAIPIFLSNHGKRDAKVDIEKLDGLVVLGNNADIDPAEYKVAKDPHTKSETDTPEGKARADYEYEIMRLARDKRMPLMGICGGMQRLNVICEGTLHQHVPDITGNDEHAQQDFNIAPFIPVQAVHIEQDTALAKIADGITAVYTPDHTVGHLPVIMENSMHHQAVKDVGKNLRKAATSQDGIIEAIEADPNGEYKDQFLMGVQWHPEFGASPLGIKLAQNMVAESQKYAAQHPHQQPSLDDVVQENIKSSLPVMKNDAAKKFKDGSVTQQMVSAAGR
jgi:gamma-glutamyl-gamma-aminobutyrate hydrolase PuuD